ncbi:MAG: hypothetical protein DRJ05_06745 [Bacteroidetes bacterium]|nr:MAG: hypothetical protein DRJ05_06745 [Bacteroidota bacterium]
MKKIQISIFFLVIFYSCSNSESKIINSNFNELTGILEIENNDATDNYLVPILRHSHIRKEGYGILLNIEKAATKKKLKSITGAFRKKDINAVHIFNIKGDSIPRNTMAAIEGAGFTWLFINEDMNYQFCEKIKPALKKSIEVNGIIVIERGKYSEEIKKCMED